MDNVIDFQPKKQNLLYKNNCVRDLNSYRRKSTKKTSLASALEKFGSFKGLQHRKLTRESHQDV